MNRRKRKRQVQLDANNSFTHSEKEKQEAESHKQSKKQQQEDESHKHSEKEKQEDESHKHSEKEKQEDGSDKHSEKKKQETEIRIQLEKQKQEEDDEVWRDDSATPSTQEVHDGSSTPSTQEVHDGSSTPSTEELSELDDTHNEQTIFNDIFYMIKATLQLWMLARNVIKFVTEHYHDSESHMYAACQKLTTFCSSNTWFIQGHTYDELSTIRRNADEFSVWKSNHKRLSTYVDVLWLNIPTDQIETVSDTREMSNQRSMYDEYMRQISEWPGYNIISTDFPTLYKQFLLDDLVLDEYSSDAISLEKSSFYLDLYSTLYIRALFCLMTMQLYVNSYNINTEVHACIIRCLKDELADRTLHEIPGNRKHPEYCTWWRNSASLLVSHMSSPIDSIIECIGKIIGLIGEWKKCTATNNLDVHLSYISKTKTELAKRVTRISRLQRDSEPLGQSNTDEFFNEYYPHAQNSEQPATDDELILELSPDQ